MQEVPERHITSSLSSFDEFSRRYQVLLQTADPVTRQALPELLLELSKLLHEVVDFNLLSYGLHDPAARTILVYTLDELVLVPEHPFELSRTGQHWKQWRCELRQRLTIQTILSDVWSARGSRGFRSASYRPSEVDMNS